jgi:hypothetical protein
VPSLAANATLRVYAELKDFLPRERRSGTGERSSRGRKSFNSA